MKISMRDLIDFDRAQASYKNRHKEDTKLSHAVERIISQVKKLNQEFNENLELELDAIRIEHCLTDPPNNPDGKVLRNEKGGYEFSRVKELIVKTKLHEARNLALDRKDVELAPHYVSLVPSDLTIEELQGLSGFVIRPEQAEQLIEAREPKEEVESIPLNGHIPSGERVSVEV